MHCTASRIPPAHVIHVSGRWEAFSAPDFDRFWADFVRAQDPRRLVLDLAGVDYISSFGLRGLLEVGKHLEAAGGAVHVAGLRPAVRKVFAGSGLASLFPAFEDAAAAAAAFTKRP